MNSSKSSGEREGLNRKIFPRVGPGPHRQPTDTARKRGKRRDAIFVAVLGMDSFAGTEIDGLSRHLDPLAFEAGEMHFDAMTLAVVKGVMLKGVEVECAAELPINSRQQIEIELCGHTLGVIISCIEYVYRLDQIGADKKYRTFP